MAALRRSLLRANYPESEPNRSSFIREAPCMRGPDVDLTAHEPVSSLHRLGVPGRPPEPSASAGAASAVDHACERRDCFSSAVRPMWCQRPGVTQRKTVRLGRLHQHVSTQPQRRRTPPTPSASAARVPTARSRTAATAPRRIRRISASLATPRRESTATRHGCALLPRMLLG